MDSYIKEMSTPVELAKSAGYAVLETLKSFEPEFPSAYSPEFDYSVSNVQDSRAMWTKQRELDKYYLAVAETTANMRSKDPKTKVGAVILSADDRKMSVGYNGFPKGFPDTDENWLSENKHNYVIHAEANCLLNSPFDSFGCSIYCTHRPCISCLKLIINAGIVRIVYSERLDWEKAYSTQELEKLYEWYILSGKEVVPI